MSKECIYRLLAVFIALMLISTVCMASDDLIFTQSSVDFYGTMQGLKVGDIISAYSPSAVMCGKFEVKKDGNYGFMHIYGDDPTTADVEGAVSGDIISFKVNGIPVYAAGPDQSIWTNDGDQINVNFSR